MGGLVGDLALGRLAPADLADDAHRPQHRGLVIGQHGDGSLDHELAAVKGPLDQLAVPVTLPRHDAGDLLDVGIAAGIEHIEQFEEPAAEGVLLGDPVQFLGRRVGERHPSVGVGGHHRIGHVVEQLSEVALLLAVGGHRSAARPQGTARI